MIAGDRVLLASSRAVERDGRRVGTVMTLRDRTEVETLARELGATKALADALRAQTHEAANRLHVIAGLVELGRAEEAIELAGSEAANAQDLLGRLGEGIEEPVLVALLLGKTATARERGVTLHVEPGRAPVRRLPADRAGHDRRQPRRQRARGARPGPRGHASASRSRTTASTPRSRSATTAPASPMPTSSPRA